MSSLRTNSVLCVMVLLSVFLVSCQNRSTQIETNKVKETFSLASQYKETTFIDNGNRSWKSYENTKYGFTLRYPANWDVYTLQLPDRDFEFGMSFNFHPETPSPSPSLYIFKDETPTLSDYALDHPKEVQVTDITVGGLPGKKFIPSDNLTQPYSPMIEIEHQGKVFSFVWAGKHPEYVSDTENEETFNFVIGSLRFTQQ